MLVEVLARKGGVQGFRGGYKGLGREVKGRRGVWAGERRG